jgi:2-haloacid dehalogenase
LKLPRGETVSGEIGLIKPDMAIYEHHSNTHSLDPAACLFFDDSPKNVDGARNAGWKAELFTDAKQMRVDLGKHGVVV